jgi:hypothetical protein
LGGDEIGNGVHFGQLCWQRFVPRRAQQKGLAIKQGLFVPLSTMLKVMGAQENPPKVRLPTSETPPESGGFDRLKSFEVEPRG